MKFLISDHFLFAKLFLWFNIIYKRAVKILISLVCVRYLQGVTFPVVVKIKYNLSFVNNSNF